MFNTFFNGSVDDLLAHIGTAPQEAIAQVGSDDEQLNRDEVIALLMDDLKMPREEAEKHADELLLEELDERVKPLIEKGFVEIEKYDEQGQPVYKPTLKGLAAFFGKNN